MWSDRETEHDCLGFSSYVDVLADVCTLPDLAPLTLGIFGSWGSGKTSLMRMLKSRIESPKDMRAKTLWFNAWRYEGREEAQSALIHAILARLAEDKTLWDDAKDVVKRIKEGASVTSLLTSSLRRLMNITLAPWLRGQASSWISRTRTTEDVGVPVAIRRANSGISAATIHGNRNLENSSPLCRGGRLRQGFLPTHKESDVGRD